MEKLEAVPAEAEEGDEKWGNDDCHYHWRISVSSGELVILRVDGDEAYLGADEAEVIGRALLDSAKIIRERQRTNRSGAYSTVSIELGYHGGPLPALPS